MNGISTQSCNNTPLISMALCSHKLPSVVNEHVFFFIIESLGRLPLTIDNSRHASCQLEPERGEGSILAVSLGVFLSLEFLEVTLLCDSSRC